MALIKFLKPQNQLEKGGRSAAPVQQDAGEPEKTCPNCHRQTPLSRLWGNDLVCTCGYHFRMKARQRIRMIADPGSFAELFPSLRSDNPLNFPGYRDKIETVQAASGEEEAVLCGTARTFHIWTGPDMKSLDMEQAMPEVYQKIASAYESPESIQE